jgi:hypothetical protein
MIYRKKRIHAKSPGGFFSLEEERTKTRLHGFGFGEHITIRDEFGNLWRGTAERGDDETVRFTFRNDHGNSISGVSDQLGLVLRDNTGKTWRGFVD